MAANHPDKIIKKIPAVVGTRRRLRMILHRKSRPVFEADSFYGAVVEIDMGNFYLSSTADCLGIYPEPMILGRDLTFTRDDIFYRVIQPAVAMVHFKGRYVIGQGQQLMTQAYSMGWGSPGPLDRK